MLSLFDNSGAKWSSLSPMSGDGEGLGPESRDRIEDRRPVLLPSLRANSIRISSNESFDCREIAFEVTLSDHKLLRFSVWVTIGLESVVEVKMEEG